MSATGQPSITNSQKKFFQYTIRGERVLEPSVRTLGGEKEERSNSYPRGTLEKKRMLLLSEKKFS